MPSRQTANPRRNEASQREFKIQPRDLEIVWMVGVHGYMTAPQIRLFAFSGWDETGWWRSVSEQAVYRRLKKLCKAGFLEHRHTWYGDHGVYRAARAGLELVGLGISPARVDKRDYEHDLRVVDLALELTDYTFNGWIPERMIRSRLQVGMSIGRVPDGLLLGPGGERWAVELEVSGKESQRYYEACQKYAKRHRVTIPDGAADLEDMEEYVDDYFDSGGEIDGVVWYFFSEKKRQRALAEANKVVAARGRQRQRTDHLNLRFHGADLPDLPPLGKREEQQRLEREAEEQRHRETEERECREREQERRREEEIRQKQLFDESWDYLSDEEQRRTRDVLAWEFGDQPQKVQDSKFMQLAIAVADEKRRAEKEKEEKKRQRRDAVKSWFTGR